MLPARHRMRRSADYGMAVRLGRRTPRATIILHLVVTDRPEPAKVGFVVTRSVGGAVVRNTVRRRLRHVVRDHVDMLPDGTLLVVRALPSAADAPTEQLRRDVSEGLARALQRPRHVVAGAPTEQRSS